jgi:hypothetical protein
MQRNISQAEMERQARSLARKTFSGQRHVVREKEKHIVNTATAIYLRWKIGVNQWQAKHIRWFLQSISSRSPGTQYRYYRYVRACLIELNKWADWEPHLRGSWQLPKGDAL